MNDPTETKAERCDRMLGELSELGMALARDLSARALAAETPEQATNLALAFHRISRSLRQTLALEAKVERDRQAAAREAERAAAIEAASEAERQADAAPDPVQQRRTRVRGALNRLIWEEADRDEEEFEVLLDELDARLDEAALREDFEDIPIETLILQLKSDMGLAGDLKLTACTPPKPTPDYPIGSDAWATGCPPDPG
jgi:hypothetical protein